MSKTSMPQTIRAGSGPDKVEFHPSRADIWARFAREGGYVDLYRVDAPDLLPDIHTEEQRHSVADLPEIHTASQRGRPFRRYFVMHSEAEGAHIISFTVAEQMTDAAPIAVLRADCLRAHKVLNTLEQCDAGKQGRGESVVGGLWQKAADLATRLAFAGPILRLPNEPTAIRDFREARRAVQEMLAWRDGHDPECIRPLTDRLAQMRQACLDEQDILQRLACTGRQTPADWRSYIDGLVAEWRDRLRGEIPPPPLPTLTTAAEALRAIDALLGCIDAELRRAADARAGTDPQRKQTSMTNPFHAQLINVAPQFESGRRAHPNVWMLEAAYHLGSDAWTVAVQGLGPSGEYAYQEPCPRPAVHELYMTALVMWMHRSRSRPLLSVSEAASSARLIVLRRSNPHPITPEVGKYNSWEQAIYLFGASEDVDAFSALAADAGALVDSTADCPPFNSHLEGICLHSDAVSQWCARVHAVIEQARPTCLWLSPPMRGGFEVRCLLDLDPWQASVLATHLLQQEEAHKKQPADGLQLTPGGGRGALPAPATTEGPETGMSWQDARDRMERLRAQGEPWTSYQKLAAQIGCSTATLYKAIQRTPELSTWAGRQPAAAPRAQSISDVVTDHTAQSTEPDPADDVAAQLRKAVEEAGPDERAFLHEMGAASREFQCWYIDQTKNAQSEHRKKWTQYVKDDSTVRAWFLAMSPTDQIAFFNDPDRRRKTFPRV